MKAIINKYNQDGDYQYEHVRIDPWDTWSMDHTLAKIILPMLIQLKATKHGSPGDLVEFQQVSDQSLQRHFDFYAEGNDAAWEAGHQRWSAILDEMIWAFQQIVDDNWEDQYWSVRPEIDFQEYPEDAGKECTPLRWKVEGVCDWDGMRAHQERINRGCELFGKYYQALWD